MDFGIRGETALVNKYMLNHYRVLKLQRWQFGDFTYKEKLFSKELNSSLPRFSVLDTFNLHVVKQKPIGPNVLTKFTLQTRKRARIRSFHS